MEFATSWRGEALPSKLYWPSVTPRPKNRCVNYIFFKFARMSISSCGGVFALFSLSLYSVVGTYRMVVSGIWCVTTLGSGALILRLTLGDA